MSLPLCSNTKAPKAGTRFGKIHFPGRSVANRQVFNDNQILLGLVARFHGRCFHKTPSSSFLRDRRRATLAMGRDGTTLWRGVKLYAGGDGVTIPGRGRRVWLASFEKKRNRLQSSSGKKALHKMTISIIAKTLKRVLRCHP